MGQPNRTRRNKNKADQFKTFKAKNTRRKNLETPTPESDEQDALIKRRSDEYIRLFDRMEREQMTPGDVRAISIFATRDALMSYAKNQDIEDLADLQVEHLTEFEHQSILKRANHALNVILQTRTNFSSGPYYTNRGMRQAQYAVARKSRGIKVKKPTTAKGIFDAMKAKKAARAATGM